MPETRFLLINSSHELDESTNSHSKTNLLPSFSCTTNTQLRSMSWQCLVCSSVTFLYNKYRLGRHDVGFYITHSFLGINPRSREQIPSLSLSQYSPTWHSSEERTSLAQTGMWKVRKIHYLYALLRIWSPFEEWRLGWPQFTFGTIP